MSEAILVNALEQLVPFLNEKNVLELVVRGNNKRIKAFGRRIDYIRRCFDELDGSRSATIRIGTKP